MNTDLLELGRRQGWAWRRPVGASGVHDKIAITLYVFGLVVLLFA